MKISALRGAARLVSRSVACIVTSSNAMRSALRDLNIQTRVEVIPNGVDMNRFRPPIDEAERVDARRRLGISRDASVLLFIGPVAPRKRIDLLLEAWCRLAPTRSDLHLVIAGPRLDMTRPHWADFHRRLETLIDRSGARERVHFLGLIEDVEDTLRAADLFVFTSSREGMPNVVAEAMASGVPVVTTPFIGLPEEFGKPGQQFRLTDFSGEGIAKDVSELLADAGRRSELARNARSWIADHLELGSSLDLYAQLYHDLGRRS
jgi:glycosyltransferase involved in cell wall biosynthesis